MKERVTGLLEKMKLPASEKKGIRVGDLQKAAAVGKDPQAVGKVLSERPIRADHLEAALGKIWCPFRGVDCKELRENRFLITFFQESGKRHALDDGPWMFEKDLVVVGIC